MQHERTDNWTDDLLAVLDRQQSLADQLAGLAQQQQQLIADQQTDALLNLLAQRQQLVNDFLITQDHFAALTTDLDDRLASLAAEQRDTVRSRIDRISSQLACVMETDEQDQQRLQTARGAIMREVEQVGANRQANTAYRAPNERHPRFTDRKG